MPTTPAITRGRGPLPKRQGTQSDALRVTNSLQLFPFPISAIRSYANVTCSPSSSVNSTPSSSHLSVFPVSRKIRRAVSSITSQPFDEGAAACMRAIVPGVGWAMFSIMATSVVRRNASLGAVYLFLCRMAESAGQSGALRRRREAGDIAATS
jgi:hypothetical protein